MGRDGNKAGKRFRPDTENLRCEERNKKKKNPSEDEEGRRKMMQLLADGLKCDGKSHLPFSPSINMNLAAEFRSKLAI